MFAARLCAAVRGYGAKVEGGGGGGGVVGGSVFSSEVLKAPRRHNFLHPVTIVPPPLMAMTHNKLSHLLARTPGARTPGLITFAGYLDGFSSSSEKPIQRSGVGLFNPLKYGPINIDPG